MASAKEVAEVVIGALPVVGSAYTAKLSAAEAAKNRAFQERMSSTAHQREVEDLRRAGLNPALSAMGGPGSSSPGGAVAQVPDFGEAAGRAVHSALAIKAQKAQIRLLEAQSLKTETEAFQSQSLFPAHSLLATANAAIADQNWQQMVQLFPTVLDKARAEVSSIRAATLLDELAAPGAFNQAKFNEFVGQAGPWGKVAANLIKLGVAGAAAGAVVKSAGRRIPKIPFRRR